MSPTCVGITCWLRFFNLASVPSLGIWTILTCRSRSSSLLNLYFIFLWKNMTALFRTLEVHLVTWNTIDSPVDDLIIERVLSPSGLISSSSLASWGRDWYGRAIFLNWGTADCWTPQRASRAGFPCRGGSAFWVRRVGFNFAHGRYH